MTIVWSITLPDYLETAGFEQKGANTVIATQMECGAPKRRRRYTAAIKPVKGGLILTATQLATLDSFYENSTAGGSLPFQWKNPITRATCMMMFTEPPSYTHLGGETWHASLSMEIRP